MVSVKSIGVVSFSLALACSAALSAAFSLSASAHELGPKAFVILRDDGASATRAFARALEAAGGHASIVYPSGALVVHADDGALSDPRLRQSILEVHRGPIAESEFSAYDDATLRSARVWNLALTMSATESDIPAGHAPLPDAGRVPVTLGKTTGPLRTLASHHLPYGAQYYDTSEFMAGSTAVGVWLLEAAGSAYDWTQAEKDQTLAGVQAGLTKWVEKGGAKSFLTFYLDIHADVPVSGVPIEHLQSDDRVWVNEVLGNAGWSGANGFEKCFAYNNAIRDTFDTNWAYSIFIVDSDPNVNQGLFLGGGYAWAYYGGPWIYMSRYSTWAYNSGRYFGVVPMHESGHIFGTTDEYDGLSQASGYLNILDTPSAAVICIMNRNDSTTVCVPTRDQLGWRDLDGDGIIEPLDTAPTITLVPVAPDPTSDWTPTWTGSSGVNTILNLNPNSNYSPPHAMTIVTIDSVECRIDGGAWSAAAPADGAFDGYAEGFSWTSPPLANGLHVVSARARTSVGSWSTTIPTDTVQVIGSPVSVGDPGAAPGRLALFPSQPNPSRGSVTLRFALHQAGPARIEIFDARGNRIRGLAARWFPAGSGSMAWDGRDDRGRVAPAGIYWYRLRVRDASLARKLIRID